MNDLNPSRMRARSWRVVHAMAVIALAATCGTASDGACPLGIADTEVTSGDSPCVREPAGQICDMGTQRCESLCGASEYLLRCKGGTLRYSTTAVPGEPPSCSAVRASVPVPADETLFCCKCEG